MAPPVYELKPRFEREASNPRELSGHRKKVHSLQFSTSGSKLASGSVDQTARIWNVGPDSIAASSVMELKGHTDTITQVCWNPTSDDQVATCSYDRMVRVWDVRAKAQEAHKIPTTNGNIYMGWSPCAKYICVGSEDNQLSLIDIRKPAIIRTKLFKYDVNEFAFTPNSAYVLVSGNGNGVGSLEVYSITRLERVWSATAHSTGIFSLRIDPTHTHLALGAQDGLASIWDLKELVPLRTVDHNKAPVRFVDFSYDGRLLALAMDDVSSVEVAEVATGKRVASVPTAGPPQCVAWHPRVLLLAWGADASSDDRSGRRRDDPAYIKYIVVPDN